MRTTHTYAALGIPEEAWDAIKAQLEIAGPEYVVRYVEGNTIHWGGEVGLVRAYMPSGKSIPESELPSVEDVQKIYAGGA